MLINVVNSNIYGGIFPKNIIIEIPNKKKRYPKNFDKLIKSE